MISQALEIIFEMYLGKGIMKKEQEKKKTFQLTKHIFSFFVFLWTPPTFKLHNFLIFYSF